LSVRIGGKVRVCPRRRNLTPANDVFLRAIIPSSFRSA
jgi:hypothetical protein